MAHARTHSDGLVRHIARAWAALQPLIARSLEAEGIAGVVKPGMGLPLFALFEQDGQMVCDIAARGQVSHVAVLQLIKRMEQGGLVKRKDCPEDGRATRVWLTASGRSLEPRMQSVRARNLATLIRILSAEDAALLDSLLGRLIEGLRADEANALKRSVSRHRPKLRKSPGAARSPGKSL